MAALDKQAAAAEQARDAAIALVQTCRQQQEQMRHARLGVSADDHPFDLGSGTPRNAADAERLLAARFDEIERLAAESGLSESSLARIAKARRVLPGLVATIAFFWQMVWSWVNRLSLPAEIEKSLIHDCLAGTYLRLAAAKAPTAERRRVLRELAEQCLARARRPNEPITTRGTRGTGTAGGRVGKPVPAVEFLRGGPERSIVVVSPQPAPAPPAALGRVDGAGELLPPPPRREHGGRTFLRSAA